MLQGFRGPPQHIRMLDAFRYWDAAAPRNLDQHLTQSMLPQFDSFFVHYNERWRMGSEQIHQLRAGHTKVLACFANVKRTLQKVIEQFCKYRWEVIVLDGYVNSRSGHATLP